MAAGFTDRMIDRAYNMSVETLLGSRWCDRRTSRVTVTATSPGRLSEGTR